MANPPSSDILSCIRGELSCPKPQPSYGDCADGGCSPPYYYSSPPPPSSSSSLSAAAAGGIVAGVLVIIKIIVIVVVVIRRCKKKRKPVMAAGGQNNYYAAGAPAAAQANYAYPVADAAAAAASPTPAAGPTVSLSTKTRRIWRSTLCYGVYYIWLQRNDVIFQEEVIKVERVVSQTKLGIWRWTKTWWRRFPLSCNIFLDLVALKDYLQG